MRLNRRTAKFPNASVDDPAALALALEAAVLLLRGGIHPGDQRFLGGEPYGILAWLDRRIRDLRGGGPTIERMVHMLDLNDPGDEFDDPRKYRRNLKALRQRIDSFLDERLG